VGYRLVAARLDGKPHDWAAITGMKAAEFIPAAE